MDEDGDVFVDVIARVDEGSLDRANSRIKDAFKDAGSVLGDVMGSDFGKGIKDALGQDVGHYGDELGEKIGAAIGKGVGDIGDKIGDGLKSVLGDELGGGIGDDLKDIIGELGSQITSLDGSLEDVDFSGMGDKLREKLTSTLGTALDSALGGVLDGVDNKFGIDSRGVGSAGKDAIDAFKRHDLPAAVDAATRAAESAGVPKGLTQIGSSAASGAALGAAFGPEGALAGAIAGATLDGLKQGFDAWGQHLDKGSTPGSPVDRNLPSTDDAHQPQVLTGTGPAQHHNLAADTAPFINAQVDADAASAAARMATGAAGRAGSLNMTVPALTRGAGGDGGTGAISMRSATISTGSADISAGTVNINGRSVNGGDSGGGAGGAGGAHPKPSLPKGTGVLGNAGAINIPHRATGGVIPGSAPGYDNQLGSLPDGSLIGLEGGEGVVNNDAMNQPGVPDLISRLNKHFDSGGVIGGGNFNPNVSIDTSHASTEQNGSKKDWQFSKTPLGRTLGKMQEDHSFNQVNTDFISLGPKSQEEISNPKAFDPYAWSHIPPIVPNGEGIAAHYAGGTTTKDGVGGGPPAGGGATPANFGATPSKAPGPGNGGEDEDEEAGTSGALNLGGGSSPNIPKASANTPKSTIPTGKGKGFGISGGVVGAVEGAAAAGANMFAPGSGAAVQIAAQEANRAAGFAGQALSTMAIEAPLDTFWLSDSGQSDPSHSWFGKLGLSMVGEHLNSKNVAGATKAPMESSSVKAQNSGDNSNQFPMVHIENQHNASNVDHDSNNRDLVSQLGAYSNSPAPYTPSRPPVTSGMSG